MEAYETVVTNARVSAEVVSLSPFAVLVSEEPVVQAAAAAGAGTDVADGKKQGTMDESKDSEVTVKPVEMDKKLPVWVVVGIPAAVLAALLIVVSIVLLKRKRRRNE